jgi:hypothetical protein
VPEDFTYVFGEAKAETLSAGFKISPLQVGGGWSGLRFAEYRGQHPHNKTENRAFVSPNRHNNKQIIFARRVSD